MAGEVITFLFTDIESSTELLEHLGDDDFQAARRRHFRQLRDAVTETGGEEVKTLGDGLMVAFRSAVDAATCAASIQRSVDRFNRRRPGLPMRVRIGLHVGEPVREEGDYFGMPVVVAQRLCGSAEPSQILCSDLVRGLVEPRGEFSFRSLDRIPLKGVADPVAVSELVWQRPGDDALTGFPDPRVGQTTAFVGRGAELDSLRELWRRAQAGSMEVVFVAGEPGIGKTRLATELASTARDEGAAVLYGRCDEEAIAPYQPFVEALHSHLGTSPLDELRERAGIEREPLADSPGLGLLGDAETDRYRMFDAVASLLADTTAHGPVVLVLDDLHWADRGTLLLLRYLLRRPSLGGLLVLGTYRDTEVDSHLTETLADIRRDFLFERMALAGLDETNVRDLITAWTGQWAPPAVTRAIHTQTDGNPFFIEEVMRHLEETGAMAQSGRDWTALERVGVPESVKEIIGRRLRRLSDVANRALQIGSVCGRDFDLSVVLTVSELPESRLLDALDEACDAGVTAEIPGELDRFAFSHALVRETLYDQLTASRRVRLHRQIATVLEDLSCSQPDAYLAQLAYHFGAGAEAGEGAEKAVDYAERAAERSLEARAYEDAARLYEMAQRATEALPHVDGAHRCELLLALGAAEWKAGDYHASRRAYFMRAARLAKEIGRNDLFVRAALGDFNFRSGDDLWSRLLEEALELVGEEPTPLRARVLATLSKALPVMAPQRESLSRDAVDIARKTGDTTALFQALWARHVALEGPDHIDERLALCHEILRVADRSGDLIAISAVHALRVQDLLEVGHTAAAFRECAIYERMVTDLRQPFSMYIAALFTAMRALLEGRLADADDLIRAAWGLGRGADPSALNLFAIQTFFLRREQGRLIHEGGPGDSVGRHPSVPALRGALALAYAELGQAHQAREELDASDLEAIPRDFNWLASMVQLSEACAYLAERNHASILYGLLSPYAEKNVVVSRGTVCLGSASRQLGQLAAVLGRWDDAIRHFEDALLANERMAARPALARTQVAFARMLLARAHTGDRTKADEMLHAAQTTANVIGMRGLADEAVVLLHEPVPPSAPGTEEEASVLTSLLTSETGQPREKVFRRTGEYWTITYAGEVIRLRDSKGLRHLAHLLQRPGVEVHALDLTAAEGGAARARPEASDAGEMLDDQAKAAYARRLAELRDELDEAEAFNDIARASKARAEMDFLADELSRAVGLGGRDRLVSSDSERARVAVTRAIRSAVAKISSDAPSLGHHLTGSISTGTFCSYTPDPRDSSLWEL